MEHFSKKRRKFSTLGIASYYIRDHLLLVINNIIKICENKTLLLNTLLYSLLNISMVKLRNNHMTDTALYSKSNVLYIYQ